MYKKINIWESFIDGAKNGFKTSVKIIPYLVGMLVGIGVFQGFGRHGFSYRRHCLAF
jgi:spore maturation protein SpmB